MTPCKKDALYIHRQKIMVLDSNDDIIIIIYISFNNIGQSKMEIISHIHQKEGKTGVKSRYRGIL